MTTPGCRPSPSQFAHLGGNLCRRRRALHQEHLDPPGAAAPSNRAAPSYGRRLDHLLGVVGLLVIHLLDRAGAVATVSTRDGGERTVARRDLAPVDSVSAWVSNLLAEHGHTAGLIRCRLRRWAKDGQPAGGLVLRPQASGAGGVGAAQTAAMERVPEPIGEFRLLWNERDALRARVAALSGEVVGLREAPSRVEALKRRVASLKAERRALRDEVARHESRARQSARRIAELEAENQTLAQGVVWINETLGGLGL